MARKYDLIRHKELKERSLEALVAGMTRIKLANVHTSDIRDRCASDISLRYLRMVLCGV